MIVPQGLGESSFAGREGRKRKGTITRPSEARALNEGLVDFLDRGDAGPDEAERLLEDDRLKSIADESRYVTADTGPED